MNIDYQQLIHGYVDDSLTSGQQEQLNHWIKSDAGHAKEFAAEIMLHDRLRNEWSILEQRSENIGRPARGASRSWSRTWFTLAMTACLLMLAGLLFLQAMSVAPASAAVVELDRIIAASSTKLDRTFSIAVEETIFQKSRRGSEDRSRPPKPSIDGALLHVRPPNQFVLQRKVKEGLFFVTGSNGSSSWAVNPEGPVRVSPDLTRFNHDVPGHENAMPLNNLHDGLEQLHDAYDVEVMPVERPDENMVPNTESIRLLVAVKKRGFRGPRRVEITYAEANGQIRQIRFIEMPYGPERLTLRMTIVEESDLGPTFFDHESHHDPKRDVKLEQ